MATDHCDMMKFRAGVQQEILELSGLKTHLG